MRWGMGRAQGLCRRSNFPVDYRFQFPPRGSELCPRWSSTRTHVRTTAGETVEISGLRPRRTNGRIQIYPAMAFPPGDGHETFGLPGSFTRTSETA